MAINGYEKFISKYERPHVDEMIVGFSGIDPGISNEEIKQEVINTLGSMTLGIDSGVIS